jgi:hypothetical protein
MVIGPINVGRRVWQSRGIGLLIPSIGSMEKRYLKISRGAGCARFARRLKNSRTTLRLRIRLLLNTSKIYTILLKTTALMSSNFELLQLMTLATLSQLPLVFSIGKFLNYG